MLLRKITPLIEDLDSMHYYAWSFNGGVEN